MSKTMTEIMKEMFEQVIRDKEKTGLFQLPKTLGPHRETMKWVLQKIQDGTLTAYDLRYTYGDETIEALMRGEVPQMATPPPDGRRRFGSGE